MLNNLKPAKGSRTPKRILGRGEGSTLGQTCGKGQKGQSCRAGDGIMNGFEGGQTPLMRRLPKRGFRHASKIFYQPINISTLDKLFCAGTEINAEVLFKAGLLSKRTTPYKILGEGTLAKALKISAPKISKSADRAIKENGGDVTVLKTIRIK